MPSTSPKPSSKNVFTPAIDPTIAPVLPEQKVEWPKIHFMEKIVLCGLSEKLIYKIRHHNKSTSK